MHRGFDSSLTQLSQCYHYPTVRCETGLLKVVELEPKARPVQLSVQVVLPTISGKGPRQPLLPQSYPTYMLLHHLQALLLTVTQLATVHLKRREKGPV